MLAYLLGCRPVLFGQYLCLTVIVVCLRVAANQLDEIQMVNLKVTSGRYESYAHRLLWDSSQRHLSIAEEHPEDSWMLHLSAGLLAAAAFEAYLNYLGEEILPNE